MRWLERHLNAPGRDQAIVLYAIKVSLACWIAGWLIIHMHLQGAALAMVAVYKLLAIRPGTPWSEILLYTLTPTAGLTILLLGHALIGAQWGMLILWCMATGIACMLIADAKWWPYPFSYLVAATAILMTMACRDLNNTIFFGIYWQVGLCVALTVVICSQYLLWPRLKPRWRTDQTPERFQTNQRALSLAIRRVLSVYTCAVLVMTLDPPGGQPAVISAFVLTMTPLGPAFVGKALHRIFGVVTGLLWAAIVMTIANATGSLMICLTAYAGCVFLGVYRGWRLGDFHYGWLQMPLALTLIIFGGDTPIGNLHQAFERFQGVLLGAAVAWLWMSMPAPGWLSIRTADGRANSTG